MSAQLMIVGTPIGNLGDWSPRAQLTLAQVGLVACEDTRRTGTLLARHGIDNPGMVVMNEHTEARAADKVVTALAGGDSVAVVTDAGMPTISDPGAFLVDTVLQAGFDVVVVPGPTAVSAALALSGFVARRYVFEGFLPRRGRDRAERLESLRSEHRMIVLYEAPHRMARTLGELTENLGGDRRCLVAREITKLHEQTWRGRLADAADSIGEPRGEYVIVLDAVDVDIEYDEAELVETIDAMLAADHSTRDIVDALVAQTGVAKKQVYGLVLDRRAKG